MEFVYTAGAQKLSEEFISKIRGTQEPNCKAHLQFKLYFQIRYGELF